MKTHLLIDADLMAYRAAAGTQTNFDWGDTGTSVTTDIEKAKLQLRDQIDKWMDELEGDGFTICLSDDFRSFRKEEIDPTYKALRADVERPLILYQLKDWMRERFPSELRPRLEADDVMGILSTEPGHAGERIIVSQDKDMKTIPGLLFRPFDDKPEVQEITTEEADRFHLWQTLTGDAVDGYPGCPGVGPIGASFAITENIGVESYYHTFTRGPRKGLEEKRWRKHEYPTTWDAVVSLYEQAGLTYSDALRQARLARILRWNDQRNWRPILWHPPA